MKGWLSVNKRKNFTVAYDSADDRERSRIDKLLKGYGQRVQWSVFECELSNGEYQRLKRDFVRLRLAHGHVRIYRVLNSRCIGCNAQGLPVSQEKTLAYVI